MKIEIKSWLNGSVLFEGDFSCLADAVSAAVKSGANLSWANLSRADLGGANLSGANLSRADLSGANLSRANLSWANLSRADLSGANLSWADLSWANLSWANLSRADLSGADLSRADLSRADLSGANLSRADLSRADLSGANLSRADLSRAESADLAIAQTRILPEGELIGWKKCADGIIAKLLIPAKAKRSHAWGRKCRAEYVKVLAVMNSAGKAVKEGESQHDQGKTVYRKGKIVKPDSWCADYTKECAAGIHFFITKEEAIAY